MKIYAISDQHGFLPVIPECDLLIVAGDNCLDYPPGAKDRVGTGPQTARQMKWFQDRWLSWREKQPAKRCLLTWGNHDYCGEVLHREAGPLVTWESRTDAAVDHLVEVDGLKIWLTPWSSQFKDWAFMADDWVLLNRYKPIPEGVDIIVSHQPPSGYGDVMFNNLGTGKYESLGSRALKETIMRVRPKVVICGHIHSGYGVSKIEHFEECRGATGVGSAETTVYNVAIVNERYEHVNPPTEIVL